MRQYNVHAYFERKSVHTAGPYPETKTGKSELLLVLE